MSVIHVGKVRGNFMPHWLFSVRSAEGQRVVTLLWILVNCTKRNIKEVFIPSGIHPCVASHLQTMDCVSLISVRIRHAGSFKFPVSAPNFLTE